MRVTWKFGVGVLLALLALWSPEAWCIGKFVICLPPNAIVSPTPFTSAQLSSVSFESDSLATLMDSLSVDSLVATPQFGSGRDTTIVNAAGDTVLIQGQGKVYFAYVPESTGVDAAIARLSTSSDIIYCDSLGSAEAFDVPNDPYFTDEWALQYNGLVTYPYPCVTGFHNTGVHVAAAWNTTTGAGVRVGIVDDGIRASHEDLAGHVIVGPAFGTGTAQYYTVHGTGCAGIVGAIANNGLGLSGVAPNATLYALRSADSDGSLSYAALANAVNWAASDSIPILSMSVGGILYTPEADAVATYALAGNFIAASMGNDDYEGREYPAAYEKAVCAVGASNTLGLRWVGGGANCCTLNCTSSPLGYHSCGSNYGSWIDVVAPGGASITTTDIFSDHDYGRCFFGGTSASAPFVAGVAALIKGARPTLTGEDIQQILNRTAQDVIQPDAEGHGGEGYDIYTGHGIVRADRAIKYITYPRLVQQKQLKALTVMDSTTGVTKHMLHVRAIPLGDFLPVTVDIYRVRGTFTYDSAYVSTPDAWVRVSGTAGIEDNGGDTYDYYTDLRGGKIVSVSTTSCVAETYVYKVHAPLIGTIWYPTDPQHATIGVTVVGTRSDVSPTRVDDLTFVRGESRKVVLTWSSPFDDENDLTAAEYDVRYSPSVINDGNFSTATRDTSIVTPVSGGSEEEYGVNVPDSCATYYFALRAKDATGHWSALSSVSGTSYCQDVTPPGSITDLGLVGANATDLALHWTSTGDDGSSGLVSHYVIRRSTTPITAGNFDSATLVSYDYYPPPSGQEITWVVSGLVACTQYYFAVMAYDEAGNKTLSNVVYVRTAGCPTPNAISTASVALVGKTRVVLEWTEPTQSGSSADSCQIRRRINSSVSDANWDGADTKIVGEFGVQAEGTQCCFEVTGLATNHTYYFGMRTKRGDAWSAVSNSPGATTHSSGSEVFCDDGSIVLVGSGNGGAATRPLHGDAAGVRPTDGEGNTVSTVNSLLWGSGTNVTDVYRLPDDPMQSDGSYGLQIADVGLHTADLDQLSLGYVDHDPGALTIVGSDGVYVGSLGPVAGVTEVTGNGTSTLAIDSTATFDAQPAQCLVVDLGGPTTGSALVIESSGGTAGAYADSTGILVQKPTMVGTWTTIGTIHPRRNFDRSVVDAQGCQQPRVVFLRDYEIKSFQRMAISSRTVPSPLTLVSADQTKVGNVESAVDSSGGSSTTISPGDTLTLTYSGAAPVSGMVRDVFLTAKGSYGTTSASAGGTSPASTDLAPAPIYQFSLGPAHPNPSSGNVSLSYTMAKQGPVSIRIYNVAGRLVRTLANGVAEPGPHDLIWNATDDGGRRVGAGVYFYRMDAGSWRSQQKVVFLER